MPEDLRTLHEMAAQVSTMREVLARIDTKLDTAVAGHTDHEQRLRVQEDVVPKDLRDQLKVIRAELEQLKKLRWMITGAAVAAGGLAGRFAAFL